MRTKLVVILCLLVVLVAAVSAFAQDRETVTNPTVQTSTVHRFADASQVDGAYARLSRYENGVTMAITTNDLTPGEAYTVWWVVFNAPENCSNGVCNEDDIFAVSEGGIPRDADGNILWDVWEARRWSTEAGIPRDEAGNRVMNMDGIAAANISVQHASGTYTADGRLTVSASLAEGDVPGIVFGPGLLDAQTAEIHLVVRTHGPAVDDVFADQVSTFGGGCDPMDAYPCDDIQFAMFAPVTN